MKKKIFNILSLIFKTFLVFSFCIILFVLLKTDILPFKYLLIYILIFSLIIIFDILTECFFKKNINSCPGPPSLILGEGPRL